VQIKIIYDLDFRGEEERARERGLLPALYDLAAAENKSLPLTLGCALEYDFTYLFHFEGLRCLPPPTSDESLTSSCAF
jgi:hypothetical protein